MNGRLSVLGAIALVFLGCSITGSEESSGSVSSAVGAPTAGGLTAKYYRQLGFAGTALTKVDKTVAFWAGTGWGQYADWAFPDGQAPGAKFSIAWDGFIQAPSSAPAALCLGSATQAKLIVNGVVAIDDWAVHGPGTRCTGSIVTNALVPIRIEFQEATGAGEIVLSWAGGGVVASSQLFYGAGDSAPPPTSPTTPTTPSPGPLTPGGLDASYYRQANFAGTALAKVDQKVAFWAGTGWGRYDDWAFPDHQSPGTSFSIVWKGALKARSTAPFQLCLDSATQAKLFVDDQLAIDAWAVHGPGVRCTSNYTLANLDSLKAIRIEFQETSGAGEAVLSWGDGTVIQPANLFHGGSSTPTPPTNPTSGGSYTIAGFRPGINVDGINVSYTYSPFDNSADGFKDEWYNALFGGGGQTGIAPKAVRFMDWSQTVGSPLVNWSDRSTSDTAITGVRYETMVRLVNQSRTVPWVNLPTMATDDFAYQFGKLWASYQGHVIKFEYGNELWNGGDQYQGTWNLRRAQAEGYPGPSDTEKMAQRAAWIGYTRLQQFKRGLVDAGWTGKVEWEWGGFIVNPTWTEWALAELGRHDVVPGNQNIRIAIAPYAPGSEDDIQGLSPSTPYADGIVKIKAFVSGSILPWIDQNKAVSTKYGLLGVDAYESRTGSLYAVKYPNMKDWWVNLQKDPGMRELQRWYWGQLFAKLGTSATLNVFGFYGIAYSQWGQWPLLDIGQLGNPMSSPNYTGVTDVVDYSAPSAF